MNSLLAIDRRYTRRQSSTSPSASPSRRASSSSSSSSGLNRGPVVVPPSILDLTVPIPDPSSNDSSISESKTHSTRSVTKRNRLNRTLTPAPPSSPPKSTKRARRRPRPITPHSLSQQRTLREQKGWWGASLVGVDLLWGGLWRAVFGDGFRGDEDEKVTRDQKGKGKEKEVVLSENRTNGKGLGTGSDSEENNTEPEQEEETDDGWVDPVTRAPEVDEEVSDGMFEQFGGSGGDGGGGRLIRGRSGREATNPPSFRLRSYSPEIVSNGTTTGSSQGALPSILTNPRQQRREDLPEEPTQLSSPSTSSKRNKLLPNPIARTLLTPTYEKPSPFDHIPTGINLTSLTSSSTFSSPHPLVGTSIFGRSFSFREEKERKRKSEQSSESQSQIQTQSMPPPTHQPPVDPLTSTSSSTSYQYQALHAPSFIRNPTPFHLPKTLILDLDETLIHSTSRPMNIQSSGMGGGGGLLGVSLAGLFPGGRRGGGGGRGEGHTVEVVLGGRSTLYHVYKRPFVDHFLKKVSSWYTLVIFTASMPEYADPVIDWLDGGRGLFGKKLYRESCSLQPNGSYTKDLSLVEDDLSRVCFMDNSPISYNWNKANALPIEGWTSDPNDEALLDMLPVLDSLRFTSDVRKVLGIRGF